MPTLPEIEQMLRDRLDILPRAARAELLHVLMVPDFERAARNGSSGPSRGAGSLPNS